MKYLKVFDTTAEYNAFKLTENFILPNVSCTMDDLTVVYYNPYVAPIVQQYDYVEIGGVKWATMNVGANSITDAGLFFQWGDTQGYTATQCINGEMPESYKYYNNINHAVTDEYLSNYSNNYTMLESDDAAKAIMGSNWRIPSDSEWLSLTSNATVTFTTNYNNSGVPGYIFTDELDSTKVLFLPAVEQAQYNNYSGFPYANGTDNPDYRTHYWNNGCYDEDGYTQYFSYQDGSGDPYIDYDSEALSNIRLNYGLPIRAIYHES